MDYDEGKSLTERKFQRLRSAAEEKPTSAFTSVLPDPPDFVPPAVMPIPDVLAAVISSQGNEAALAALAHSASRRDPSAAKGMEPVTVFDPSVTVMARADARMMVPEPDQAIFMSRYTKLVVYVSAGARKDLKIEFKNGIFTTSDQEIADALHAHPRKGYLFRGEQNVRTAAVRAEVARQRDGMRTPTFAGTGTSIDGAEQTFFGADRALAALEQRAIETGSVG